MKIRLENGWFAPTVPETVGNRTLSGHFYDKGEHEVADWLFPHLPKSATVLEMPDGFKKASTLEEAPADTLRNYDMARAAAEADGHILTNIEKARMARMAKIAAKKAAAESDDNI